VQLLHSPARTRAVFDDPNLLAHAGLAPLLTLAGRAGLPDLLAGAQPAGPGGANAVTKAMCLIAGMAAGADSIDDMDLLRDGATEAVFGGIRAPSTLGSFLRSFTWGNVRQLDRAHRGLTAALAADPRLLPGREVLAFIDIDSTQERVYGYQKEGAAFGHAKVQGKSLLLKGLNPLISVISTPLAAPVLGPVRLRGGSAGPARGAAGLAAEAIGTAREAGCTGKVIARFDSAFYNSAVIRTVTRHGAHFSVTVPANSSVRPAIAGIPEDAWTAIRYPQAVWDDQLECWISDAEVAETRYTAFTSKKKSHQVTARLIVRRVRARNEKAAQGQGEPSPRLPPPCRLHRFPVRNTAVRRESPGPRDRRAGHRRPERRPARPSAIRSFRRKRCLARPRRNGAQPAARRRNPRRDPLRQGAHRHRPPRPHRHARPDRPPRPREPHPAPARRPPPRARLAEPVDRSLRPARRSGLTSPDPVRTPRRTAHPPPTPTRRTRTSRTKGERQDAHARIHLQKPLVEADLIPNSVGGSRLRALMSADEPFGVSVCILAIPGFRCAEVMLSVTKGDNLKSEATWTQWYYCDELSPEKGISGDRASDAGA
jgi:Transposase DDE domain group 1